MDACEGVCWWFLLGLGLWWESKAVLEEVDQPRLGFLACFLWVTGGVVVVGLVGEGRRWGDEGRATTSWVSCSLFPLLLLLESGEGS